MNDHQHLKQVDFSAFTNEFYRIRDSLALFWQHPQIFKAELMANHVLLFEVVAFAFILLIFLILVLKPAAKEKAPPKKVNPAPPKPVALQAKKSFGKILSEQQKREPARARTGRPSPVPKKANPPLHDLSPEEERSLQEAMVTAGRQALAEVTGGPHQTEIFQSTQASEAAKKLFAGSRSKSDEMDEAPESQDHASPLEFIMIYFMAPRSQSFETETLFTLMQEFGLNLNENKVFEYTTADETQFYVSSAVKPGYFDIHKQHSLIPGLAFVLDLHSVQQKEVAFNCMLQCIHEISQVLRGDILDENRQRLNQASIHQYMARVKNATF